MEIITSYAEVFIEGVRITKSFKMEEYVHKDYIENVECIRLSEDKIKVTAEIKSNDRNSNYVYYLNLKEYLLRVFILFGINVRIDEVKSNIDTGHDYVLLKQGMSPLLKSTKPEEILSYTQNIKNTMHSLEKDEEFFNLIKSNEDIDIIHRFRSLFAAFDKMAPKNRKGYGVNYHRVKKDFSKLINLLYKGSMFTRYHETIKLFIEAELIDERDKDKKNYSKELEKEFSKMKKGEIINESVAFNILKCINLTRNRIVHGSFQKLKPKTVSGAYEMLLPLTQQMLKDKLNK